MKLTKIFAAALAASTIAGSAFAADLPSRKVAPAYIAPAPIFTWTGFYIGLNAGGTFGGNNNVSAVASPVFNAGVAGAPAFQVQQDIALSGAGVGGGGKGGFIGGGQIGWNWQSGAFLAGIEADIQGLASNRSGGSYFSAPQVAGVTGPSVTVATITNKLDYLGTLRARVGFLATPSWLLYATGGLAYGGVKSSYAAFQNFPGTAVNPSFAAAAFSQTRLGYTVGAGAEWMFASNWSAKLEYLYYDLGSVSYNTAMVTSAPAGNPFTVDAITIRARQNGHVVRAGLNYHFNWGAAPVVAKY